MVGLNLLVAIIIYWNTNQLGHAVAQRKRDGLECSPELLSHISPLGWAHILLTGEYRWPKRWSPELNVRSCPLPDSTRNTLRRARINRVSGNTPLQTPTSFCTTFLGSYWTVALLEAVKERLRALPGKRRCQAPIEQSSCRKLFPVRTSPLKPCFVPGRRLPAATLGSTWRLSIKARARPSAPKKLNLQTVVVGAIKVTAHHRDVDCV